MLAVRSEGRARSGPRPIRCLSPSRYGSHLPGRPASVQRSLIVSQVTRPGKNQNLRHTGGHSPLTWGARPGAPSVGFERVSSVDRLVPPAALGKIAATHPLAPLTGSNSMG
jgi:hypothetical protein